MGSKVKWFLYFLEVFILQKYFLADQILGVLLYIYILFPQNLGVGFAQSYGCCYTSVWYFFFNYLHVLREAAVFYHHHYLFLQKKAMNGFIPLVSKVSSYCPWMIKFDIHEKKMQNFHSSASSPHSPSSALPFMTITSIQSQWRDFLKNEVGNKGRITSLHRLEGDS